MSPVGLGPRRRGGYHPNPLQPGWGGFPLSGSSRESFAHGGVTVDDLCRWQRVTREESGELSPIQSASPSRQPFLPDPSDLMEVPAEPTNIASYAVVGVVAPHLRDQLGMLLGDRPMSVFPTPVRHRC